MIYRDFGEGLWIAKKTVVEDLLTLADKAFQNNGNKSLPSSSRITES